MVKTCVIQHCTTFTGKNPLNVVLHELPLPTNERILWLNAIEGHMKKRRSHVKSDNNLNVCGLHFMDDAYMSGSKRLRKLAVPTIFNPSAPVFTLKVVDETQQNKRPCKGKLNF